MTRKLINFVYYQFQDGKPYPNGVKDNHLRREELPDQNPAVPTNLYGFSYATDRFDIKDHSIYDIIDDEETIYYFPLSHYLPFVEFHFPQDVIDIIENKSNIIILYYYSIEAYICGEQFDEVKQTLSKFNISEHRKFYITADAGIESYTPQNGPYDMHILYLDLWQFDSKEQTKGRLPKLPPKSVNLEKPRSKHFLCLNGKDREHRRYILSYMWYNDILDSTYLSFIGRGHVSPLPEGIEFCQTEDERAKYIEYWKNFERILLDAPSEEVDRQDRRMDLRFVRDSYFNIVTETWFKNTHPEYVFITEKTWKAVLWCQPFIIVGNAGSLSVLQERGFYTFPEIFDESYDEILDTNERMQKVASEIYRISQKPLEEIHQMYVDVFPKLKYNYERMYNYDYTTEVLDMFGTIEVIYENAG